MAQIKKLSTELQPLDKLLDSSGDAGTAGQVLSSTGSGTNWIAAGGSGTVTGSGTDNYIPLWNGTTALDDSIMFQTGTDQVKMSSAGNAYFTIRTATTTSTTNLEFADSSGASGALLYNHTSNSLAFKVNGSERMRIDNSGRVGIGTTSPARPLDVNGSARLSDGSSLEWGGTSANIAGSSSSDTLFFRTASTERARIDSSGNVGIGTTSPIRKLSVSSSSIVSSEFKGSNAGHLIDISNANASPTYNGIRFQHNNTFKMGVTHIADGTTKGYVQIGNGYATGNEILVVDGRNSHVGIGTTSPGSKLEVNGNILATVADNGTIKAQYDANNTIQLQANSGGGVLSANASGATNILLRSYGDSYFNGGKVGIGTTAPNEKIEVTGNIRASGSYKVGATEVISSGRRFFAADGTSGAPAYSFSGRTSTGISASDYSVGVDRLNFNANGGTRGYVSTIGIVSSTNYYVGTTGQWRNYGGVWRGTTGVTGNGFEFFNTADNSSAVLLSITSVASAATDSVATFSGKVVSAQTASSDGNGVLTTKSYVDGLVTGVTRYMGLWDASSGTGGNPDLTASTYKVPGYYFIVSVAGDAEPNGAGTEPDTWHVGDWVIWSDQATDAWQKIDNTSVLSGSGTANKVAMWNGTESLTDSPITISGINSSFAGTVTTSAVTITNQNPSLNFTDSSGSTYTAQWRFKDNDLQYLWGGGIKAYFTTSGIGIGDNGTTADARIERTGSSPYGLTFKTNNTSALSLDASQNATFAGNVGIAITSPASTLHVLGPNSASGGITLTSSTSDNTQKVGRIKTSHYDTSEEPFTAILTNAQASDNILRLGGGSGAENAATDIRFYTAANNTTLTGTERLHINESGNATFSGNVTLYSRLTFDYGGDHYFEAGTNTLAYKSSGGASIMLLNASTSAATFAGNVLLGGNDDYIAFNTSGSGSDPKIKMNSDASFTFLNTAGSTSLTLDNSGNATFAGDVTVSGGDVYTTRVQNNGTNGDLALVAPNGTGEVILNNGGIKLTTTTGTGPNSQGGIEVYNNILTTYVEATDIYAFRLYSRVNNVDITSTSITLSGNATTPSAENIDFKVNGQAASNTKLSITPSAIFVKTELDMDDIIDMNDNKITELATPTSSTDAATKGYIDTAVGSYLPLAGGTMTGTSGVLFPDSFKLNLGTSSDLQIYHNATNSIISNATGNLYIKTTGADKDIVFEADDGSGGTVAEYFKVDGGAEQVIFSKEIKLLDSVLLKIGGGGDLRLSHNGTNSFITNNTGDLTITNNTNDGDIIFKSDDGTGGTTEYFRVDGGSERVESSKSFRFADGARAQFGASSDLQIYHDATNSKIENDYGEIRIINNAVDKAVMLQATSNGTGSNVTESYLSLSPFFGDGSVFIYKDILIPQDGDNGKIRLGASQDLEIYHDGSNSFVSDTGTGGLFLEANSEMRFRKQGTAEIMAQFLADAECRLYYNNSQKFATTSTGIAVTGDIADRDIPCLFNSNFEDSYGSSIIVVPFNNNTETNVSTRTYNHNLTMPYAGKLTKIIMKHVSGTLSSSFTTQLFLYVNGTQQTSSSELQLNNNSVSWAPTSSNTFSAGDVLTFAYQKSGIKTFGGVSFGIAVELTNYDI